MLDKMDAGITITIPTSLELGLGGNNISLVLSTDFDEVSASQADPEYEQFLADVWVGIVLTLMVLSCVCCMCSCLLYHKFQQWKRSVLEARAAANLESGGNPEIDSLPSYTIVSGLPSYEEALEQLKKVKEITKGSKNNSSSSLAQAPPPSFNSFHRLSITELFQLYRASTATPSTPAAAEPPNNTVKN